MTRAITDPSGGSDGDWWIFGYDNDPIPQDADELRTMATLYRRFADDVNASASGARSLLMDPTVSSWLGKSAEAFKAASEPFPGMLDSAEKAYRETGDAFATLADVVDDIRQQAVALLRTAESGRDAMATASGLPDDQLRRLVGARGPSSVTYLLDSYAGSTALPPDVYKANYGTVVDCWIKISNTELPMQDLVSRLATAKNAWTLAVEDGIARANAIVAGLGKQGRGSYDFNASFQAYGGDLADLAEYEGAGSDAAAVAATVAYFHQHLRDFDNVDGRQLIDKLNALTPDEVDEFINSLSPDDLKALNERIKQDSDSPWEYATPILGGVSAATLALVQSALPAMLPGTKKGVVWKDFSSTPLFADGQEGITGNPTDTSLNQGSGDDCWFLTSIASISLRNPNFFQSRVYQNPNGTYTVTFYDGDGKPFHVVVDGQLPINDKNEWVYAYPGSGPKGNPASIWTPIMEKAYASYVGSYGAMTAGQSYTGLHTLTGQHIGTGTAAGTSLGDLQKLLDQGDAVQTTSLPRQVMNLNWLDGISSAHIVGTHVYTVERIDRSVHPPQIVLLNPWGAQGSSPDNPYETRISVDQWNNCFYTYSHTTIRP